MNDRLQRYLARVREFGDTGRRLVEERRDALETVDRLLHDTPRAGWPALSELPELQTAGALERLGNLFAEWLPKEADHAKAIAELAVAAAEALPEQSYPALVIGQLRAHAWKDLGIAYRTLARLDESLEAFATAMGSLGAYAALVHDRAIVNLARALTLQELERFEEARTLIAEAAQVFRDHGDMNRHVLATFSAGVLLQRMKHHREARGVYQRLTRAGLNKRAITALGYLEEAIAAAKASAALITDVREYIVSLRTYPEREFRPSRPTASSLEP